MLIVRGVLEYLPERFEALRVGDVLAPEGRTPRPRHPLLDLAGNGQVQNGRLR